MRGTYLGRGGTCPGWGRGTYPGRGGGGGKVGMPWPVHLLRLPTEGISCHKSARSLLESCRRPKAITKLTLNEPANIHRMVPAT